MVEEKQKSPNWDEWKGKYQNYNGNNRIPGFPFDEGFPKMYGGKEYELIDVNGEKYIARVDDSREFSSEGLEWKVKGNGNKFRSSIVAWCEI